VYAVSADSVTPVLAATDCTSEHCSAAVDLSLLYSSTDRGSSVADTSVVCPDNRSKEFSVDVSAAEWHSGCSDGGTTTSRSRHAGRADAALRRRAGRWVRRASCLSAKLTLGGGDARRRASNAKLSGASDPDNVTNFFPSDFIRDRSPSVGVQRILFPL